MKYHNADKIDELELEKEELLAEIAVFEKYNVPIPSMLKEKKKQLLSASFENRIKDVIKSSINDSDYYNGFELLVFREGKCIIKDFSDYFDQERLCDLKEEEATFKKYHAPIPDYLTAEIEDLMSIKLLSDFLKERIQDLVEEVSIECDYYVKVTAEGRISIEETCFEAIPEMEPSTDQKEEAVLDVLQDRSFKGELTIDVSMLGQGYIALDPKLFDSIQPFLECEKQYENTKVYEVCLCCDQIQYFAKIFSTISDDPENNIIILDWVNSGFEYLLNAYFSQDFVKREGNYKYDIINDPKKEFLTLIFDKDNRRFISK